HSTAPLVPYPTLFRSASPGQSSAGRLLLGVDYYPDQTPESLWEEDARMMAETGITNVRIAEFAWALMEPAEGKFDFPWLHRAVEDRKSTRLNSSHQII